jgi:hypothetical protein
LGLDLGQEVGLVGLGVGQELVAGDEILDDDLGLGRLAELDAGLLELDLARPRVDADDGAARGAQEAQRGG